VKEVGLGGQVRRIPEIKAAGGSECLGAVIFGSQFALAVIFGYKRQRNRMTSLHTKYESASTAPHRRRHLIVAL